jgi:hypothetical protein
MATIIAGRFDQQSDVDHATKELVDAGFTRNRIASFYLNPAGQHATYPIGGDADKSAGAKESGKGIAAGAAAGAAIGVAATPFLGPVGAVTGGLVGAHVGGLVGGLSQMKENGDAGENAEDIDNVLPVRHAGMYLAITVDEPPGEARACELLTAAGALDLERAQGTISDGDWSDFDASVPPDLLQPAKRKRPDGPTQRA